MDKINFDLKSLNDIDFCKYKIEKHENLNILIIEVETQDEALDIVINYTDTIVSFIISTGITYAKINYDWNRKPYIIYKEMGKIFNCNTSTSTFEENMSELILNPELNSLFINCRITDNLLPVISQILENPEKNIGVTRIRDNSQVIVSSKHVLTMGTTGKNATSIRTTDYWLTECLLDLQRKYKQEEGVFEHEIITSNYVYKWLEDAPWVSMHVKYRLIDDGFGEIYRVGETLGVEDIRTPANIN